MRKLIPGFVLAVALFGLAVLIGPRLTLRSEVLHQEASADAGVTYGPSGSRRSSDLYLVELWHITGTHYELHLGPGAKHHYYPVEVGFGSAVPRIREVSWQPGGVTVTFTTADTVHVPAGNFSSVR